MHGLGWAGMPEDHDEQRLRAETDAWLVECDRQFEARFKKEHPMKIEAGKFYKTRDGRKVGPMVRRNGMRDHEGFYYNEDDGTCPGLEDMGLISEWPSSSPVSNGPVRTVTKREIVPGVYGWVTVKEAPMRNTVGIEVAGVKGGPVIIGATELRAAAATLIELADALEDLV